MFDVVIVGGGPAGMAAALALGRVHRQVSLIDAGEGRNAPADNVHNFLTRDGTPPAELRELGRRELAAYPSVRITTGAVTGVRTLDDGVFRLALSGGGTADARRLLLATGLADELPGPRGVEALWGRSAFHCPYCHGYECTGRQVAVLGTEPARVRLALQLSRFAAHVVLCADGRPLDQGTRDLLEANGVAVRCEAVARLEGADGRLEQIVFEAGPPLARDAVFVVNVPRQRSDLAGRLGCDTFADGCVEVDEFGRTSVPGVYAAGDMAHRASVPMPLAAVVAAAASGAVAAAVIDQELLSADFGLPDPLARAKG
ncbi:NAD(P)/FAD-dependent oxidoreductase [Nonomuraea spiralis]|uniref:NAD(P)/FAD-dependent oxidoreductase n=1 Tax=Nonomuraea TaxID=83681 RepID=UPI000F7993F3|nr:NAD(P)/FAD-dependent oxidoreductase [Nonomuraea sp. WAC 01424]RSM97162.1 NAD(P)/FAD-dependent oxidoreductase [Nonomuraea sp. WAC 01424]